MPWGLKRYYDTGGPHFITWSCYRRMPLLGDPAARDLFLNVVELMRVLRPPFRKKRERMGHPASL